MQLVERGIDVFITLEEGSLCEKDGGNNSSVLQKYGLVDLSTTPYTLPLAFGSTSNQPQKSIVLTPGRRKRSLSSSGEYSSQRQDIQSKKASEGRQSMQQNHYVPLHFTQSIFHD